MIIDSLLVAHAGQGTAWQALVTAISIGLIVVFLLAVVGRVRIVRFGDLVFPLAIVAVLAGFVTPLASDTLSDWVGYAAPAGMTALVALALTAATSMELQWSDPLTIGVVVVAAVGAVLLGPRLNHAWHPTELAGAATAGMDGDRLVTALCEARSQAQRPSEARRVFERDAHGPLHDVAREVNDVDRGVGSELQERKYRVESALTGDESELISERLGSLIEATRNSLSRLGQPTDPCRDEQG